MNSSEIKVDSCIYSDQKLSTEIFRVRNEVFVVEQMVSREEEFDEFEQSSIHYLGTIAGRPAGTARWRITSGGIKLERFAVVKDLRNSGIGSAILQKVLDDVIPLNLPVYLNAQLKAIPFYERHGFKKVGDMFVEANIDHFKMVFGK